MTAKELNSKYGKLSSLGPRWPPRYDLETTIIEKIEIDPKGKKSYVYIQEAVGQIATEQVRYILVHKNDEWRIDKKESWNESKNKWEKDYF